MNIRGIQSTLGLTMNLNALAFQVFNGAVGTAPINRKHFIELTNW
ncbi:hypothetical protein SAMN05216303_104324 [Rhodoferax sp. OV413]|nr:hypothetical protein SAMN05216303_104324 [Rhodoferax sp. OV413]